MIDFMDGIMWALATSKAQWKEDLIFAVELVWQKQSKYYAEVTPSTGMLLISARIDNSFWKLLLCMKWDEGMDINPEDGTSYTTQYQEVILMYVENEYCAKRQRVQVNKPETVLSSNLIPSAMASRFSQSSFDPYDLSSDDEEYWTPNNVAETTPRWSHRAARSLSAARLCLNSPPEAPKNCRQINSNLNDYHSDRMEISSTFWLPDITAWWCEKEEIHSKYADLSNVARDIFSTIPHGLGVEASFSLGRDVIGWRQSKTTGKTVPKKVVVRQFAQANNDMLAGADPVLDTTNKQNDSEIKKVVDKRKLHRMAQVHDFLEKLQRSQNLRATQKKSRDQIKHMTAVGYISDTQGILDASWSLFQHDGAAAFKLSEKSLLPPALSANNLPGEQTQILNIGQIRRMNRHRVESDENSALESISDTEDCLNWHGDLDNANDSDDNCTADIESDIVQDNAIEDPECPEQRDVGAAPNDSGLIWPTRKSKRQGEKSLVTVNAIKSRRNKGVETK